MTSDHEHYIDRWLTHIRVLAEEIGPRGPTTPEERRASEYCQEALVQIGLDPRTESFTSARSIFHQPLLCAIAMLVAFAIYPLGGRVSAGLAALLSVVAVVSVTMELVFRDNPLRRLVPKAPSQNVVVTIPPASEHRQDLVLVGHVDTQRTLVIFQTQRWIAAYRVYITIAFVLWLLQVLLYALGAVTQWTWIWPVTILTALATLGEVAFYLHAERTPFSAGANDNASGAGLVLALAERFQADPLAHTRVWLACTGCEEAQHYGAADFYRRHVAELHHPVSLVFEFLGCTGPAWLTKEGIVIPFHADRDLVTLAHELSAQHPEWGAYPAQINGGNTEMADALRVGVPAITLIGMGPRGEVPYVHQVHDTFDKMDREVMGRAFDFAWAYIQALDARSAHRE
jgi:hypothetical protein